jgi:hypothetical protein
MHSAVPYKVVVPRACRVSTPDGTQEGLIIGEHQDSKLVLHGDGKEASLSWTPSPEVWLLDNGDWAPWSDALAANA